MDIPNTLRQTPAVASMSTEPSEELLADVDEPPDNVQGPFCWSPPNLCAGYMRAPSKPIDRRESLLTRQIQSETEHTDHEMPLSPVRALSTQSTWSSVSMPSTAELTSDDGRSMPSMAGSPPSPRTISHHVLPVDKKPIEQAVKIVGQDAPVAPVDAVEANLGRKRCIKFACKGNAEEKAAPPPVEPAKVEPASAPKRKCMLKFVCPTRSEASSKIAGEVKPKRAASPAPQSSGRSMPALTHRGSDATLKRGSVSPNRKGSASQADVDRTSQPLAELPIRKSSYDSDGASGAEATRFHEFATSEDEREDWTQMTTCFRSRLTIDDTLKKEHVIRKTCEEAEKEELEDEEELEEDTAVELTSDNEDVGEGADEDDDTDDGFHSDDENGFGSSDSESDSGSEFEWWRPGGLSTAATSVDHLDRLAFINAQQNAPSTSAGSHSSAQMSPFASRVNMRKHSSKQKRTAAVAIDRAASPGLPDSTDFVCGTLDEDRPLEQEFVNRRKQKEAAKKGFCPQDIDPTFPTSDPEAEDDDDDEGEEDDAARPVMDSDDMMHGNIDEIDGLGTARRRSMVKCKPTARSPATTVINRHHSPPPPKQRAKCHSPPPPTRRSLARSPAPPSRKLFGHSPHRMKSPAPLNRMTSPPNSPVERGIKFPTAPVGLGAHRTQLTLAASLPRGGIQVMADRLTTIASNDEDSDDSNRNIGVPKRRAVDIVKGLEKKRQIRERRYAQRAAAKATKGEKIYKVKPGLGCEKMREVGLAIQNYRGKAGHILSY